MSSMRGSIDNFTGASFETHTRGLVRLTDPNFDVLTYTARVSGETSMVIAFAVYGDPASFTISGSTNADLEYRVELWQGGTIYYECDIFDDPCDTIGGSGTMPAGVYSFRADVRDFAQRWWCADCEGTQPSGTETANSDLKAFLSVSHQVVNAGVHPR